MDEGKTIAYYQSWDPYQSGVTHVAIEIQFEPPYVWRAYWSPGDPLPNLPSDMLLLPIAEAKEQFNFVEGNIAQLVR